MQDHPMNQKRPLDPEPRLKTSSSSARGPDREILSNMHDSRDHRNPRNDLDDELQAKWNEQNRPSSSSRIRSPLPMMKDSPSHRLPVLDRDRESSKGPNPSGSEYERYSNRNDEMWNPDNASYAGSRQDRDPSKNEYGASDFRRLQSDERDQHFGQGHPSPTHGRNKPIMDEAASASRDSHYGAPSSQYDGQTDIGRSTLSSDPRAGYSGGYDSNQSSSARPEAYSGLPGARTEPIEYASHAEMSGVDRPNREQVEQDRPKDGKPSLDGFSRARDGRRYRLVVVQHPSRARMCGFGDKDRRPLSPTLIVKLVVTDEATRAEISPLEINTSLFLLATDLCHPDDLMLAPRNILVHHHASALPASSMGFPPPSQRSDAASYRSAGSSLGSYAGGGGAQVESESRAQAASYRGNGQELAHHSSHLPPISSLELPGNRSGLDVHPEPSQSASRTYGSPGRVSQGAAPPMVFGANFMPGPTESYTRNLVGAAVASASVLKDESDKWCIFFVFQDISVRTEGVYRIKLMFANLEVNGRVGTGVTEALAETYTEPFTVYSPRRFPGMLDPTPLSRKLASQGIKIPVRNDKKKQRRRTDDVDATQGGNASATGGYDDEQDGGEDDDE